MTTQKKQARPVDQQTQDAIIAKQIHQLNIDLKRGLLPYVILFFLKIRPHYSLEIQKKMSFDQEHFNIRQNIIYQNLKKFEQKGIVDSYYEKSKVGARRKYYFLTDLGERLFTEVVVSRLFPLIHMFSSTMGSMIAGFGIEQKIAPEDMERIQAHLSEVLDG